MNLVSYRLNFPIYVAALKFLEENPKERKKKTKKQKSARLGLFKKRREEKYLAIFSHSCFFINNSSVDLGVNVFLWMS